MLQTAEQTPQGARVLYEGCQPVRTREEERCRGQERPRVVLLQQRRCSSPDRRTRQGTIGTQPRGRTALRGNQGTSVRSGGLSSPGAGLREARPESRGGS